MVSDPHVRSTPSAARQAYFGTSSVAHNPWVEEPYLDRGRGRCTYMVDLWLHDIESLEAVTQDEQTRQLCLRMAAMSQAGTLGPFIATIHRDEDLDELTKGTLTEIAGDANFLLAVEDYVGRTQHVH